MRNLLPFGQSYCWGILLLIFRMNLLETSIEYLKGVGPKRGQLLKKELGLSNYSDLLHFFPFRYVDRSHFHKINGLISATTEVQIVGTLGVIKEQGAGPKKRLTAQFSDETGSVELIWFKGVKWVKDSLKIGSTYVLYGKPSVYQNRFNFPHPELELLNDFKANPINGLQPVYPSTERLSNQGLNGKAIGKLLKNLLPQLQNTLQEYLPDYLIKKYRLKGCREAYNQVHFPANIEELEKAQRRLKFDEFLFLQFELLQQKQLHRETIKGFAFKNLGSYFNDFYKQVLPFTLTGAQQRVLKEIRKDLRQGIHMNRLVQGDVGSGKTIVALMAMLMALDNNFQACLMAPTEILANQHFSSLKELTQPLGVEIALLTGSTKSAERRKIHEQLENGTLKILIGTHALIEDKVKFKNLGLAVVDEQHKFGVAQRASLWKKNSLPPHILVMTATPIPRTLAMSVYGHLDISVIDELPPGRKEIETHHRYDSSRLQVFGFMKQQIELGRQVYVVYPLIEESEKMDYKDLMDGYESIERAFPKPNCQISIVHGRMTAEAKEIEMQRFVKGQTQIMVATTVIEVGVNVPNASIMVIESSERFGLSQLHQLRGRVGRGAEQSYCILMSSYKLSANAKTRLKTMVETNDGFKISEVDMKLRGPGDLMGTRQSGDLNLKLASLVLDGAILEQARLCVQKILNNDPQLALMPHQPLKRKLQEKLADKTQWGKIS